MFPQIMNEYIQKCAEEVGIHIELDMSESERVWDVMKVGFKDEYADVGALNTSFYTRFPNVFQKFAGTWAAPSTPASTATRSTMPVSRPAYAATDEAESTQQFIEAEKIFTEELPWVIVCNDRNLRVLAPNVQNFAQSQTWYVDLDDGYRRVREPRLISAVISGKRLWPAASETWPQAAVYKGS